jgi:FAD/FMN-containing dehydrogenase
VVQPSSARLLSLVLRIIVHFQVLFAVRSGGHSPNPGWASIGQPGMLIDLSRLDAVRVNADVSLVSVGAGQRWGAVLAALDPYNVTVVGGRLPNLGVGGFLLGGMWAPLSKDFQLEFGRSYYLVLTNTFAAIFVM